MDKERLARIQPLIEREVASGNVAGMSVLVYQGGHEQLFAAAGMADRELGKEVRRDTIFRMFSMSKPVTSAACMLLVERGELDLNTSVGDYLPEYAQQTVCAPGGPVPAVRPVTVLDLMSMSSGLVYPGAGDEAERAVAKVVDEEQRRLDAGAPRDTQELMAAVGRCPLAFQPGSMWRYGLSADVVAAVVEKVSGMRYGEFLQKELFRPLGMSDTAFWVPPEKKERFAQVYQHTTEGLRPFLGRNLAVGCYDMPPAYEAGGAGLVSTIDDYMRFARMLLGEGMLEGTRVLSPGTVRLMRQPQLPYEKLSAYWEAPQGYEYGHLMRVMARDGWCAGLCSHGEFGWDGWLGTYFTVAPQEELAMVVMMQRCDAGTLPITRKLRSVVYSAI